MNKRIELLSPAGSLEKAYIAYNFGADAVYVGAKAYSLRARAGNFDYDDLKEICQYAHENNKKIYLVINIICHNTLVDSFANFFKKISKLNFDGYICADPFIINSIKKINPNAQLHISTQQSVCNSKASLFFKNQQATRIVTSREVTYDNLALMSSHLKDEIELECFIHGAVCISYSGQCMMSNNFSLRDANIGGCAQSCRWVWTLYDDTKVYSKNFSMSAKDMSQINNIDKLIDIGISSLKIEGRMKSVHYIATIVDAYRKTIDSYLKYERMVFYEKEIIKAANRLISTAWFHGRPSFEQMLYHEELRELNQNFIFIIDQKIDNNKYIVLSKNYFENNSMVEVFGPGHELMLTSVVSIVDHDGNEVEKANTPMRKYTVTFSSNIEANIGDIARNK